MSKREFNFTKAAIEAIEPPPAGKRVTYHDTKIHGLQLRVTSNGVKTFSVFRWIAVDNKPERLTLGRYPELSIEAARAKATAINATIAVGENPNRAVRERKAEMTFNELFELYIERWGKPHKKTWQEDERTYRVHIKNDPRIATSKLSRITKNDLAALHARIGKTHPIVANRTLALISSVFGRASEWGIWSKPNPVQSIRKFPEKTRDRFIQSEELPLFFEALAQEPNAMLQDYFMLLLLTGVRRSNLLSMRWDEISLSRKEWRIPETKNGTPQVISLDDGHGAMMRILEARQKGSTSPWVFPSDRKDGHLVEPRKCWERIMARAELFQLISAVGEQEAWTDKRIHSAKLEANQRLEKSLAEYQAKAKKLGLNIEKAGLHDLRIHDLRRTLGSWMAGTGASTVMIGKQLNHKSPSATAIYSRLQLDPVKEARNKAVSAMFGAGGVTQGAEVIKLKGIK